ncbi:MAG: hypothetical protein IPO92_19690 [Saprospiraceae bacterium]|nr:hypothetical protein [Saprospiraceae bacterium]
MVICNDNVVNVTLGTFTDLAGSAASDFKFKAYMDYTSMNVNFTESYQPTGVSNRKKTF